MIRAGRARCGRRSHQAQALTSRRSSARMAVLAMPSARRPAIHCSNGRYCLLIALSSADVDLRSLLPDVWIAAHPEHFLQYRRDEAEAAARARKRRREKRRAESKARLPAG